MCIVLNLIVQRFPHQAEILEDNNNILYSA
jgi:hypothetical protein